MATRVLTLILCIGLALSGQPLMALQSSPTDTDLATGIRQVREGEFDAALITLDGVVNRLSAQKDQAKDLARAYTYLAIAYVGLAQQESAKAKFREAWKADKSMTLSPKEFPPNIIEVFDQVRKEGQSDAPAPQASAQAKPTSKQKGGGGGKGLLIIGGVVAAAGGVALAASGGGSTPPPATTPPACSAGQFTASNARFQTPSVACPPGRSTPTNVIAFDVANNSRASVTITSVTLAESCPFVSPGFTCTPRVELLAPGFSTSSVAAGTQTTVTTGTISAGCNNTLSSNIGAVGFSVNYALTIETSCGSLRLVPQSPWQFLF